MSLYEFLFYILLIFIGVVLVTVGFLMLVDNVKKDEVKLTFEQKEYTQELNRKSLYDGMREERDNALHE